MVPGELALFGLDELERAKEWAAGSPHTTPNRRHRERPKHFSHTAIPLQMAYRHVHGRKGWLIHPMNTQAPVTRRIRCRRIRRPGAEYLATPT
jgi:hypothetical protein